MKHVLVLLYLYNHISAYDPKYSRIICIGIDNRYSAIKIGRASCRERV